VARQARIEYPGALYHVICRGIERRDLLRDDVDRERYLALLEKSVGRFGLRVFAYCLMGNHLHLAVEAGKVPLSRVMRSLNTSYAGYFNARHRRAGYLFQGRYKAYLVDREEYLVSLIRYIHENPVEAGLVERPREYRWSSHRAYLRGGPAWLAAEEVLARFGRRRSIARKNFQTFFGEREERPYRDARRYVQSVVGDEGFARKVLEALPKDPPVIRRLEARQLVEWVGQQEGVPVATLSGPGRRRDHARVRALCGYLGREVMRLPLSQIARVLGRGQSTLWRDVARLEEELKRNPRLRQTLGTRKRDLVRWVNNT
jgi:putative transposase